MKNNVVIVGAGGHVGLPLGLVLADKGLNVTLLEVDQQKVSLILNGRMPFHEIGAEAILKRVVKRHLHASVDASCLTAADVVTCVIGTPVDKHLNPTIKELYKTIDVLTSQMQENALLVLRSTVYPGLTQLVYQRILSGKKKIHLAFCPERIAEGKALEELVELPQIVAGCGPEAERLAAEFFLQIAPAVIRLSPLEAELAKLFSNSWRYLNFAVSNQFYMIAQSCGVDFYRIHEAITRDYPRMQSFARAGFAAGPCLLKDTLQLSAFSKNNFFMGHAAMLINEGLPEAILEQLRQLHAVNRRVAILGMAFKGDSDDARDSLSYKLKNLLEMYATEVLCTDPYVSDSSLVPLEEAIHKAEVIILGAPHSLYRNLRFDRKKTVIDVWGLWRLTGADVESQEATMLEMRTGG